MRKTAWGRTSSTPWHTDNRVPVPRPDEARSGAPPGHRSTGVVSATVVVIGVLPESDWQDGTGRPGTDASGFRPRPEPGRHDAEPTPPSREVSSAWPPCAAALSVHAGWCTAGRPAPTRRAPPDADRGGPAVHRVRSG